MPTDFDPFTVEIVRDKLSAAADEMGVVLARASMSPIVYEVLDFACGITDASAQVIAQTNGLTLFTGTFGPQVQSVVEKFGVDNLHEGDVFATNISYDGGTHTSDVCLIKPIFFESRIVGFGVSVTHWIEIGGAVAGSIPPDATEIYQEGLRLPGIRVVEAGETNQTVWDIIEANIRLPITGIGDLNAGLAAVGIAERRVVEACERYGVELVDATFEHILEHGERVARAALREIPNGVYTAEDLIDGDGITDDPIPIKVTVTVDDESLHADFTGSAPQTRGPINCAAGALLSACKTVVRAITDPQAKSNDGFFRPLTITIPPGTIFSAEAPAPTGWYYESASCANDLFWKALAPIVPDRLGAGSYMSLSAAYLIGTERESGELFVLAEPNIGGWGGSALGDGENALIATTDGDTYNFPVEVVETRYPVLMERYELDTESGGGAGMNRGGLGCVREYRLYGVDDASGYGSCSGARRAPWPLEGGSPGSHNYLEYNQAGEAYRVGSTPKVALADGDRAMVVTAAGGGFGDPLDRDPERVLNDVVDGYVSLARAREDYGVVIDPKSMTVDASATDELRVERRDVSG